ECAPIEAAVAHRAVGGINRFHDSGILADVNFRFVDERRDDVEHLLENIGLDLPLEQPSSPRIPSEIRSTIIQVPWRPCRDQYSRHVCWHFTQRYMRVVGSSAARVCRITPNAS